jgi:hypothetical protein
MRNGDMNALVNSAGQQTTVYDPWSTDANTWARTPYPNNQLPVNRLNPLAKLLFGVTPLPTLANVNPNIANNWFGAVSQPQRSWTSSARVDQRFGDKDQFYGRYTQGNYRSLSQFYSLRRSISRFRPTGNVLALARVWLYPGTARFARAVQ